MNNCVGSYRFSLMTLFKTGQVVQIIQCGRAVRLNLCLLAMSGYEIKRSLGSVSFGEVFLAKKGRHCYTIKKVKNTDSTAKQEIKILRSVSHPRIINYFGHYWERGMMCIVLEYADKGTFENLVLGKFSKKEYIIWRALYHLSSALTFLHALRPKQVLHRDLKPDNILGINE